jgi:hypothetical protein
MLNLLLHTEEEKLPMSLLTPNAYHNAYEAHWPKSTHWRRATCREVNCGDYLNGWVTSLDPRIYKEQAFFIEHDRERTYKKVIGEDGKHHYYFEAGQRCFESEIKKDHIKKLERGPVLRKDRKILEADRWIDEFNEQTYRNNIRR